MISAGLVWQVSALCLFFMIQQHVCQEWSSSSSSSHRHHVIAKRKTTDSCPDGYIVDLNGNCVKKFKIPKRKQCPPPEVSKFGSYELKSAGRFAMFYCEDGWSLAPPHEHAMCKVGAWDRDIPNCVRPGCQRISVEEGVRMQRVMSGALMEFECYDGNMVLVGPSVLGCDGEFWNGTAPVCKEPPSTSAPELDMEKLPATTTNAPATQLRVDASGATSPSKATSFLVSTLAAALVFLRILLPAV